MRPCRCRHRSPRPAPMPVWTGALLRRYAAFCRRVRQLDADTIGQQRLYVIRFLDWLNAGSRREFLQRLTCRRLQQFQIQYARDHGPGSCAWAQQSLRGLLRFLRYSGALALDLSGAVGSVHRPRWASVPKGIDGERTRRLLASLDRHSPDGRRDFAMVVLLATYGVRGGQLRRLRLHDIDWDHRRIRFPALKGGKPVEQFLTSAAGNSLLAWLRDGRPTPTRHPEVFLSLEPPFGPFRRAVTFSHLIDRRLRQAGIGLPPGVSRGTHSFRHAFAMRLAGRVPFHHLADLLGHRDPASTWTYAKVDFTALAETAAPWPEEPQP